MQEKSSLDFAGRLSLSLAKAGMKASTLASMAGVSKGYVSDLLKRKKESPSTETCKKFAEVLSVPQVWLFFGDDAAVREANPKDSPALSAEKIAADAALFPDATPEELDSARRDLSKIGDALAPYRDFHAKMAAVQALFIDSSYSELRTLMRSTNAWPPAGEDENLSFTQLWKKYASPTNQPAQDSIRAPGSRKRDLEEP